MKTVEELEARLEVATRERDEARAEVERLYKANAKWIAGWVRTGIEPNDVPHHESYRRGAEAMREACIDWCKAWENDGQSIADALADLPIPEEP
jgi:hypothetical protein